MVTQFAPGNYRSLTNVGRPFSDGIIADPGYDLVRAVFPRPRPLYEALEVARRHVQAAGRPATALAGFELRVPEPLTPEGFAAFNGPYVTRMTELGLSTSEGLVTTRTNVSPTVAGVTEPSLLAFTYTVPSPGARGTAYRLSGATETRSDGTTAERLRSIVDVLDGQLVELGATWDQATAITVYGAACDLDGATLARFGVAGLHGVRWYPSLPPVVGIGFEIDAHSVGIEQQV
ncbi:MAG: hypothetical protein WAM30_07675 [Candidatus Dormiibacterota bacterium]